MRPIQAYLRTLLAMALAVPTWGQGVLAWQPGAAMPEVRSYASAATANDIVYVLGDTPWSSNTNCLSAFDPHSQTWSQLADIPTGRGMAAADAIDDRVYVVGGNNSGSNNWLRSFEAYDTSTGQWHTLPDLPGQWPRGLLAATAIAGKLYVTGGGNSYYPESSNEMFIYDPQTGWSQGPDLPHARSHHSSVAVNGRLYVIGGKWQIQHGVEHPRPEVDVYDPETGSWSSAAPLPTTRGLLATVAVENRIYAIGGQSILSDGWHGSLDTVEEYDPSLDTWGPATALPTPLREHASAVVGDRVYVLGGYDDASRVSATLVSAEACRGDLTGDGLVGLDDLAGMLAVFGSRSGDAGFEPLADLEMNGTIGLADLAGLLASFGTVCN